MAGGSLGGGNLVFLPAPSAAGGDWLIGPVLANSIGVTRNVPVPGGATAMNWRAINDVTGQVDFQGFNLNSVVSGTRYRVQAAWVSSGPVVSDWSPSAVVTTP